jgi:hypothetical protein
LAKNIVQWNLRDREAVFNGSIRALARAAALGAKVTGMADGTDLETTARDRGDGLRLEGALVDRCGHQDALDGQGREDAGA